MKTRVLQDIELGSGFDRFAMTLDSWGVTLGDTRLSVWTMLVTAVVIILALIGARLAIRAASWLLGKITALDGTQRLLAQKLVSIAIWVTTFLITVDVLGIDLTALAVFSGAFGLAVGFGLQKTIGNLIAGIILLMDRSIKPGDVIVVGESFGWVNRIGIRAVSVLTRDGKEHLIPNENLMTQEVENWSYSNPNVRVHITVTIAYDCDVALAQKLMIEAALHPQRVLKVPAPNVWMRAFGDNGLEHDILVWIKDPEAGIGNVQSEILNRLWVLFRKNGINVPSPQRDVRIKEWKGEENDLSPHPAAR